MRLSEVGKSMIRLPNHRGVMWAPITERGVPGGAVRQVRRTLRHAEGAAAHARFAAAGPRDQAAKDAYLRSVGEVKAARAARRAAGMTPRGSQADELARTQRERAQRASADLRASNARDRVARRREAAYVRQVDQEYRNVRSQPFQWGVRAAVPAVIVGSESYRRKVSKGDRERAAAAGGVTGAAAGYGVTGQVGYGAKKLLARRRRDALIKDPAYRETYRREWGAFRQREGFHSLKDLKNNTERAKVMARYPKTLKDWRGQRALAFKNKPGPYAALVAGPAVVGAALAYRSAGGGRREAR